MHCLVGRVSATAIFALLMLGSSATAVSAQEDGVDGPSPATATTSVSPQPDTDITQDVDGEDELPEDLLVGEAPGEDVPETDVTVPPRGAYASQGEFKPNEVLWSSLRAAEVRLEQVVASRDAQVEAVRRQRLRLKRLRHHQMSLDAQERQAILDLGEAEKTLKQRAVSAFVNAEKMDNAILGTIKAAEHDEVLDLASRKTLIDTVLSQDDLAIDEYVSLRDHLDGRLVRAAEAARDLEWDLVESLQEAAILDQDVADTEDELEVFQAGSAVFIPGVRFPVGEGYDIPLINSWGFPRMPGTPDEHWHEGIDIFAPAGTPLLAAERGVISRVGSGRLGGLTLWIKGESGANWYYAHLLDFAEGIEPGTPLEPGDLVGYVGNTGNAITTPAHVHLELHPGGGEPVDPYPLLKVVSDRELAGLDQTSVDGVGP